MDIDPQPPTSGQLVTQLAVELPGQQLALADPPSAPLDPAAMQLADQVHQFAEAAAPPHAATASDAVADHLVRQSLEAQEAVQQSQELEALRAQRGGSLILPSDRALIEKRFPGMTPDQRTRLLSAIEGIKAQSFLMRRDADPPLMLPLARAEDFDPRTATVRIEKLAFQRPALLPVPTKMLQATLSKYEREFKAVQATLPVLGIPMFTPKLFLLLRGTAWGVCIESLDLLLYYAAVQTVFCGTIDVVRPDMKQRFIAELSNDQHVAYEAFAAEVEQAERELSRRLPPGADLHLCPDRQALRDLWTAVQAFTYSYTLAYEKFICQFLLDENQMEHSGRVRTDSVQDELLRSAGGTTAVEPPRSMTRAERRRQAKEKAAPKPEPGPTRGGIPQSTLGDLLSPARWPSIEHVADVLVKDTQKKAAELTELRASLIPAIRLAHCNVAPTEPEAAPEVLTVPPCPVSPFYDNDTLAKLWVFVLSEENLLETLLQRATPPQQQPAPLPPPPALEPLPG